MPSEREGGDPRHNEEDAFLTFMEMDDREWRGVCSSLLAGGVLQPEERKGFMRALEARKQLQP